MPRLTFKIVTNTFSYITCQIIFQPLRRFYIHNIKGVHVFRNALIADVHRDMLERVPGQKNTYIYSKDIYNKKGKRIRKAGEILLPQDRYNEHCSWVYIVNAEWAKQHTGLITELNKEILQGKFDGQLEFKYYTYEQYAIDFLKPADYGYRLYKKTHHNWEAKDASHVTHIDKRKLDMEQDFYQFAKAHKGKKHLAVYCEQPYITVTGQRFYGDYYFNKHDFLKQIKNDHYALQSG